MQAPAGMGGGGNHGYRAGNDACVASAWLSSVEEMQATSAVQLGASACGPTALVDILKACGVDPMPSSDAILAAAPARLRDHSTPSLLGYLTSRAKAGTIHEDLIRGVEELTSGDVSGVFFTVDQYASPDALSSWLHRWISLRAVPMVTLNLFLEGRDAYHHQTVFGVEPGGVWACNPVMKYTPAHLLALLTGGRHMVIPRRHVLSRLQAACADGTIQELLDEAESLDALPPWSEFNVGTQVKRILLEATSASSTARDDAAGDQPAVFRDLVIPWGGIPGITVFALSGSPAMAELHAEAQRSPVAHIDLPLYPAVDGSAVRSTPIILQGPHHNNGNGARTTVSDTEAELRHQLATIAHEMAELAAEYKIQAAGAACAAALEAELKQTRRELHESGEAAARSRRDLLEEIERLKRFLSASPGANLVPSSES